MRRNQFILIFVFLIMLTLLACSKETSHGGQAQKSESTAEFKDYTDSKNRNVSIPTHPKKIVYVGSNPGDILALGIKPIGASLQVIGTQVAYPDLLEDIEDIGYPVNLEKVTALNPDLILFNDWDDKAIASLEKLAPTVVISEASTFERMAEYAEIFDKSKEMKQFKENYEAKVKEIKTSNDLPKNTEATVLLQLGKERYIMGHQGLSVMLFDELEFTPQEKVASLIKGGERFVDVSDEVLADYMGDVVFVLTDDSKETSAETAKLFNSKLWETLPAVQKNQVYVMDSKWNYDDPITRERLLDEIDKAFK